MSKGEPQGCLAALLGILGIRLPASETRRKVPFRLRDDFMSKAELSFYHVLRNAIGKDQVVFSKVNLSDLFFVVRPQENPGYRNKIDRKHVDFLVCSARDAKPCFAVELDDVSHARADRIERDAFVDSVFRAAGLPLIRVKASRTYDQRELQRLLASVSTQPVNSQPVSSQPAASFHTMAESAGTSAEPPECSKCGVPMTRRTSRRGVNRGAAFWGCVNYPRCREVKKIS